jgi:hypothetical protein
VPRSKANPRHAGPLTLHGNHIPTLFDQPTLCGHPRRYVGAVQEGWCHSMTQCLPLPYLLHVTPSKEDGGTLERGTTAYSTPAWDDAVTLGRRNASRPSPPALCSHPHRCVAIPGTAGPSPALWGSRLTGHFHAYRCAASGLPSAKPSNWRTYGDQTKTPTLPPRSHPWTGTGPATTPARGEICQDDCQFHDTIRHAAAHIT